MTTQQAKISVGAAAAMRSVIALAGGREVCFVATLGEDGCIAAARAVARGDSRSVLALPGVAKRGQMLVHNHPSGELEPSAADFEVANALHLDGIGFGIIDNAVSDLYVVVEVAEERIPERLVPEDLARELASGGRVANVIGDFEERESQLAMARDIAKLYNNGGVGLLEAGTGVGKSFAYLLPALRWSALNGDRTVVSTNTINLQEQLVGSDLPLLARALDDQKVSFALLKGWRNYICLSRLGNAVEESATLFDSATTAEVKHLAQWAATSADGSLGDMLVQPSAETWDEVAAEPDLCTRQKCKHFEKCFVFRARREAARASVVVVNHHLLLADLAVRRLQQNWTEAAVLPAYDRLIVDEGHHLEDAAASHLGLTVSRRGMMRLLARLDRKGRGILATLVSIFARERDLIGTASRDLIEERLIPATETTRRLALRLFELLEAHLSLEESATIRIDAGFADHPVWREGLREVLEDLYAEIRVLSNALEQLRGRLTAVKTGEADLPAIAELGAVIRRLESAGTALDTTLRPRKDGEPSVRWLERRGKDPNVVATTVPLDLSAVIREDLFRRVKTAVVTSATLASNGSFEFVRRRLGLTEPDLEPRAATFSSPFHFQEQALIVVPTDFPLPGDGTGAHLSAVVEAMRTLCELSDGGIFVLCTSRRDVRAIAAAFRGSQPRWPLLVHGEADTRDHMLRRFRESGRAVLVGTASFWEGVDVRGDALRGLLITRLPFKVPTEPMTAAQCEAIAASGGDPFNDYLLPHAALRLRQGCGRLIRSTTDWGAMVIADSRLAIRGYGETLVDSLPPARRAIGPWARVSADLRKFYNHRKTP